jgi:hypothetical protein
LPQFALELKVAPGGQSDDTTFAAEGAWASCSNVRFVNGIPQTVGGESGELGGSINTGRGLFAYLSGTTARVLVSDQNVLARFTVGVGLTDITPAGGWSDAAGTSFGMWGSTALINRSGGKLYQYSDSGVATVVTGPPLQITRMVVNPEKRQVLALGCNEEASPFTFNGRCVRWCDLEDYTNWTTTSTNNAGEDVLNGDGVIVTGAFVGGELAILTSTALYQGTFIGDPGQTYRFDRVAEGCGCAGLNAFTVSGSIIYWLGADRQLWAWQPGAPPEIIPCPIQADFQSHLASSNASSVYLTHLSRYDEIRISYIDSRDGGNVPSRWIAYSPRESILAQRPVWSAGTGAYAAMVDSPVLTSALSSYGTSVIVTKPGDVDIRAADCSTVGPTSFSIRTADRYLNSGMTRVQIQGINFNHEYADTVNLTIYTRNRPDSTTETTWGPYDISPSASGNKDFRASGMIASVEFSGAGRWRMGKPAFRCVTMGGR